MSLTNEILSVESNLIGSICNGNATPSVISAWLSLATKIEKAESNGNLEARDAQVAIRVASRVKQLTTSIIDLEAESSTMIGNFCADIQNLLICDSPSPSPPPAPLTRAKRACRPSLRPRRPSTPPPPRQLQPLGTSHDPRSLPLRHWFLTHLSFPYPSPDEKLSIASDCGITRGKVDSDMTNWRRRSGWTDMMVRFGGDRELMKSLIERVERKLERGEEVRGTDKDVEEAVDGVRRYLKGMGPKVEIGWLDDLSTSTGIKTSTTSSAKPNPRKRRNRSPSSLSSDPSDSEDEDGPTESSLPPPPPPTQRSMPHIPSISSLSTTSTLFNSYPSGVRTVSGSSYATDSTFAEIESEFGHKQYPTQAEPTDTFKFTPMYASAHGLAPSMVPQISKKRPAETVLESGVSKSTRNDSTYYHPGPSSSSTSYPSSYPQQSQPSRSVSHHSSHTSLSSHASVSRTPSPSSVTDIETNYIPIPYPSFSSSGQILQGQSSGSGSGSRPGSGGRVGGEGEEGGHQQVIWSTTAPLATLDPGFVGQGYTMPILPQEFAFAPRFEARA